jgi:hypothetical protein
VVALLALVQSGLSFSAVPAQSQEPAAEPTLYTNEAYVEDVNRRTSLNIADLKSVLSFVLSQLPPRVRVFPTENYYYFYFYLNGIKYAGNFRFDVGARDEGLVEFVYFKDTTDLFEEEQDHHATLGADDGVMVTKVAELVYEVGFAGRSVVFELNDLSEVTPPQGALIEGESFLGPVADESGIRFFLVFDESAKVFRYLLDETVPVADELIAGAKTRHVLVGRRTSYAFFQDDILQRKVLIGVYAGNIDVNNYLDGPFDQLPDNFLEGDELRRALLAARPDIDEPIDRLGISPDGESRELIGPYVEYGSLRELLPAETCAAEKDEAARYRCLDAIVSG